MFGRHLYNYVFLLLLGITPIVGGCSKHTDEPQPGTGYLTLTFNISNVPTRGSQNIDGVGSENRFNTLDLFFYATTANDDTESILHHHATVSGSSAKLDLGNFQDLIDHPASTFKVIAVANCTATRSAGKPSINELKRTLTQADATNNGNTKIRAFRAEDAPEDFVMTNFDNPSEITFNEAEDATGELVFKRLAAKIRVAIELPEKIQQDGRTWTPDLDDMRIYFTNGVRTARLDGDVSKMTLNDTGEDYENSDYFSIATSGSKQTEDYKFARKLTEHLMTDVTGSVDSDDYKYVNDLPLYTYPNRWEDNIFETHQSTVIIVVAWETGSGGNYEYKPSYYSMPVNKDDKIVSNTYYYLRAHIGMMGGESPKKPLEVDMECEIADWGVAQETTADIRPVRFLQFNQTSYEVFNENSFTIPFYSSHNCTVVGFKGQFYTYNNDYGEEKESTFDTTIRQGNPTDGSGFGKGKFFYYEIDNKNNTLTFTHDFFNIWQGSYSGNKLVRVNGPMSSQNRTDTHKFYSRFEVELTVRHSDLLSEAETEYEETVFLTLYPAIYITVERIEGKAYNANDGWIFVNGYAYGDNTTTELNTGNLGRVGHAPTASQSAVMTTITLTQLDDEYKERWTIGDPRLRYINNELDDDSMLNPSEDHYVTWNNGSTYGGPYDGTATSGATATRNATNRHRSDAANTCQTIWEEFPNTSLTIPWANWIAKNDYWSADEYLEDGSENPQYHRTLSYYYPTDELDENTEDMIAPKFTMVSMHSYSADLMSKENARRRCATYQQYGYPAGRWRLPTHAEIQYIKELQLRNILVDIFGGSNNWSAHCRVNREGNFISETGTSYVRCLYDTWYWEQVDAEGISYNRIPNPDGSHDNWRKFHWGDRPKESTVSHSGEQFSVERFLETQRGMQPVENTK